MVLPLDDPNLRYLVTGGTPLGDLERRLRPSFFPESPPSDGVDGMEVKAHAGFADYSRAGFLGHDENLLGVVHRDWQVLERYGVSHKQLATRLSEAIPVWSRNALARKVNGWIAGRSLATDYEFAKAYAVTFGSQGCPWGCQAGGKTAGFIRKRGLSETEKVAIEFIVAGEITSGRDSFRLLDEEFEDDPADPVLIQTKKYLLDGRHGVFAPVTGLLPHLIRRHYFFEGHDSPYRADPELLIKALKLG